MHRPIAVTILIGAVLSGGPVSGALPPELISPRGSVELRCPTFSWAARSEGGGLELVVYRVSDQGEVADRPLVSVRLPHGASSWTPSPSGGGCLDGAGRFAWTVRPLNDGGPSSWAAPVFFTLASPSVTEVQAAIAVLRRHLTSVREPAPTPATGVDPTSSAGEGTTVGVGVARPAAERPASRSAPTLATPSLTVDAGIALGTASNLFKDGSVFLWDDVTGNTALGRLALASATGDASQNTAVGREALQNTTAGSISIHGSYNTAVGDRAMKSNTDGFRNVAVGYRAMTGNTTGFENTAVGVRALSANETGSQNAAAGNDALFSNTEGFANAAFGWRALSGNTSGYDNTAVGYQALTGNGDGSRNTGIGSHTLSFPDPGSDHTAVGYRALWKNQGGSRNLALGSLAGQNVTGGSDNVFILNEGAASDTGKIRIGTQGTQDAAFVAGIHGASVDGASDLPVLVDDTGKLGTATSSRRFKEGIEDLGAVSERLLDLRAVRFRYVEQEGEGPEQYGLVAEEVAEVFPELVVADPAGEPLSVRYHVLVPLLLNEVQRSRRDLAAQAAELAALRERLAALERGRSEDSYSSTSSGTSSGAATQERSSRTSSARCAATHRDAP